MKLHLSLKREYFDAIKAGTKVEEYRLITDYWSKRLVGKSYEGIVLKWGYPKTGDTEFVIERPWLGFVRKTITHPHFGANPVEVFAIDVSGRQALKGGSE
ncbi:RNA-binding protein [Ochrobactrum sp. P6BS-III]|uniref:RNA-binding protein n=1 Tax=unclassified Ochrobactrum TaxID=239106 RepID=UPI00099473F1|nr:hypothetical protein [Ochrobactrum sp. P6BSIII]OOL20152.1 RNA-binding protein [Ochrobactrum sp. P6BS-III]